MQIIKNNYPIDALIYDLEYQRLNINPPSRARMEPTGRSANCGNGLSIQCVRLVSEICQNNST